jgi:hypothetical protein
MLGCNHLHHIHISLSCGTRARTCLLRTDETSRWKGGAQRRCGLGMAGPLDVPSSNVVERRARTKQPHRAGRKPRPSTPAYANRALLSCPQAPSLSIFNPLSSFPLLGTAFMGAGPTKRKLTRCLPARVLCDGSYQ